MEPTLQRNDGALTGPFAESIAGVDEGSVVDDETASRIARMIEAKRPVYETFARRGDFGIRTGEKTCYDHGSNTVIIGVEQLAKMGITSEHEVDFAAEHELGHMRELFDDPEGYERIISEGKREDGLGNVYFRFYNCLMDIYVNANNANRSPVFRQQNQFTEEVSDMYRKKFFPERDFTKNPRSVQFSDYLLNLGMNAGDDLTLSPEVAAVIEEGLMVRGKHKTFAEFIHEYLVPVIGNKGADWQATAGQRKRMIDNFLRPIFESLLEIDKQTAADLENVEPGGAEGDLDAESFGDALADAKDKQAKRNRTAADKAKDERGKQLGEMADELNLTPEAAQKFQELYEKMQPTIYQLVDMWKKLRSSTVSWEQKDEGYYKTGSKLSVPKVIADWGSIQKAPDEVPVMERRRYEEKEEWRPRNFRLRVIPDLSGSMGDDIEMVQELAIALAGSLSVLNSESRLADPKSPGITCALDIIGFSDDAIPIIENNEEISLRDIMATYSKIAVVNGTSDHTALQVVDDSIDPETTAAIQAGDTIDIMIEITDGDTSEEALSRRLVDSIAGKGVVVGAIKFGSGVRLDKPTDQPEEDFRKEREATERDKFNYIWNQGAPEIRGYRIRKAEELPTTLYQMLKKIIEKTTE